MPERRRDTLPKNRRTSSAGGPNSAAGRARRISRREKEAKQRRQLYWGLGAAGTLIVVILLIFSANQYWFRPRHVLATVNGTDIRRSDYWKVRSFDLINQINTYSSYAQNPSLSPDQQQQYSSFAQSAASDLNKTWNSTSLDDSTLANMVEDQVYLQNADKLGVTITDQDIDNYITQLFQPADAPLITATPTPTLIPERAAWATQTAEAETATAQAAAGTPVSGEASPVAAGGTPIASGASPAAAVATPISGIASPAVPPGSPAAAATPTDGSPAASPVISASATATAGPATPDPEQAMATVTATYKSFKDVSLKTAHMSESDFRRLIVKPAIARQKVKAAIDDQIGQRAEQVHVAHILVDTKDLADTIYQQLQQPDANFEQIAKDQSEDSTTAPTGGDLGWIAKGQMVPEFENVAFSTEPGQISQPFQTKYGWHIVKVYDKDPNRPMTADQLAAVQAQALTNWVNEQKATMKITSEAVPTATPATSTFSPPPGAPPTATATVEAASPVAGEASPAASPVANVEASPAAGSPSASPAP